MAPLLVKTPLIVATVLENSTKPPLPIVTRWPMTAVVPLAVNFVRRPDDRICLDFEACRRV
jgi:hypothetical protein